MVGIKLKTKVEIGTICWSKCKIQLLYTSNQICVTTWYLLFKGGQF